MVFKVILIFLPCNCSTGTIYLIKFTTDNEATLFSTIMVFVLMCKTYVILDFDNSCYMQIADLQYCSNYHFLRNSYLGYHHVPQWQKVYDALVGVVWTGKWIQRPYIKKWPRFTTYTLPPHLCAVIAPPTTLHLGWYWHTQVPYRKISRQWYNHIG